MADPPLSLPSITSDPFPGPPAPPPPLLRNPSSSSSSFDASPLPYNESTIPQPSLIPLSSNHLPPPSAAQSSSLSTDRSNPEEQETILSSPSSAYTAELARSQPTPRSDQLSLDVPSPNPSNSLLENDYSTTSPLLSTSSQPPPPLIHHSSSSNSTSQSHPQSNGQSGIGIGISSSSSVGTSTPNYPYHRNQYSSSTSRQERMSEDQQQGSTLPVVPTEFDEGVLRALCDLDCGMPLLLDRLKQSSASCRETSQFLKKRAVIEEEYARSMSKLVKSSIESYGLSDGKAGSFVNSYLSLLKSHDLLSDNRLKFSLQLSEMSDELSVLGKEVEKTRKSGKELGTRLERGLNEQEGLVEKARVRFDQSAEELERLLLLKSGESLSTTSIPHATPPPSSSSSSSTTTTGGGGSSSSKGRSLMSKLKGGPKNPAAVARQEEELRIRMGQTSDSFRAATEGMRNHKQEYFNLQLPKLLRSLKEGSDELDLGTQYHLSRYAYLFESLLVTDGLTLSPVSIEDGPGVKSVIESIDSQEDFKTYMQQYALNWQMSGQRGPRREVPNDSIGTYHARPPISPRASSSTLGIRPSLPSPTGPIVNLTFGVDLGDQMLRDSVEVPLVLSKCAEAIEREGLDSMGIYRLSGTTSRVQRLKACLDRDLEGTDLMSEDNLSDINDIAAVLKLWFRELPEPLLTWELYHQFIDVSKIENDRLRHIRLHERVNELPDPNYATLKYLMGHLDKVAQRESSNQMSVSNLAIVFGPNLLSPPPPHLAHHFPPPPNTSTSASSSNGESNGAGENGNSGGGGTSLADTQFKCKCVETILSHYKEIFVE